MSRIEISPVTGWGYATSATRPWPASQVFSLSLGGTEIIQGTGTVRCIDSEGRHFWDHYQ